MSERTTNMSLSEAELYANTLSKIKESAQLDNFYDGKLSLCPATLPDGKVVNVICNCVVNSELKEVFIKPLAIIDCSLIGAITLPPEVADGKEMYNKIMRVFTQEVQLDETAKKY